MRKDKKAQAPLEIRHRRCLPCLRQGSLTGQVSLELGAAFICIFLILLASVRIATWVVGRMVVRQEDYERSRVNAASTNIGQEIDESDTARYQKLNIFR